MTTADQEPLATFTCELCGIPHRIRIARCDHCNHTLGRPPDWEALQAELPPLRKQMALGGGLLVLMVIGNGLIFDGAFYVVAIAPASWMLVAAWRHRQLKQLLKRHPGSVAEQVR